jgi:serpin B
LKNFTTEDGTIEKLPMMENIGVFDYAGDEQVQAIRLPYKSGHYSMVVMMPTDPSVSLDQLLNKMTGTSWRQLLGKMTLKNCHLQMPRFETATEANLKDVLCTMGMKAAFSNGQADFNRMFKSLSDSFFVGLLKQKAKIQVDEYGTVAAAVTVGYMTTGMPDVFFNADRPFIYVITEKDSQAIFFIGKVTGKE